MHVSGPYSRDRVERTIRTWTTVNSSVRLLLSRRDTTFFSTTLRATLLEPVQFHVLDRSVISVMFVPFIKLEAYGRHFRLAEVLDRKEGVMLWNLISPRMKPVMLE
jgi:hypothetical protein